MMSMLVNEVQVKNFVTTFVADQTRVARRSPLEREERQRLHASTSASGVQRAQLYSQQ